MRLLVFEYITGGGLVDSVLPVSLLQEGTLMCNALLNDLRVINDLELVVLQDERLANTERIISTNIRYIQIARGDDIHAILTARQDDYDSVWLIAPETGGILAHWCQLFSAQGKFLYTSGEQAVSICQDKQATTRVLQQAGITCVPSVAFDSSKEYQPGSWVVKVNDSVGCEQVYLMHNAADFERIVAYLVSDKQYLIQPYIVGKVLSLSAFFYQGEACFICCNQQHIRIEQQQFVLAACTVNIAHNNTAKYQSLCAAIAAAMPQLYGYVGIDFIATACGENLILEINPRLTTSYTGIKQALGVNIAELLIKTPQQLPQINRSRNQQVLIAIE